ncbi:MAG: hypothetical protein HN509_05990 [Halobacteriovoraceae bacterium]|jgi:hypothetical protein|nr:hypothetical protein [Halobacteriovoraceae bacterium]
MSPKTLLVPLVVLFAVYSPSSHALFGEFFKYRGGMESKLSDFKDTINSEDFSTSECQDLVSVAVERFNDHEFDSDEIKELLKDTQIIQKVYRVRQEMLTKFKEWHRLDNSYRDTACADEIRKMNDELRWVEDYLGAHLHERRGKSDKKLQPTFSGIYPNLLTPNGKKFNYKKDILDGDILVTKGNFFFSGALAKIGKIDTRFSHQGILHRRDGDIYAAEAHPEIGSTIRKIELMNNNDKNVRTMVLRFSDSAIAAKAGNHGYSLVKDGVLDEHGKRVNIPYDFWMDYSETDYIFCSELVSHSFHVATEGETYFPTYRTNIELTKSDFAKNLGIQNADAIHPGDIEFDYRVETVAEWRDYSRIMDNLIKDELLGMLYHWMEKKDYFLDTSAKAAFHENVTFKLRPLPLFSSLLHDFFPTHMPKEYVGTIVTLRSAGQPLYTRLAEENEETFREKGRFMQRREMQVYLEKLRRKDHQRWLKWRALKKNPRRYRESLRRNQHLPWFHSQFHPPTK